MFRRIIPAGFAFLILVSLPLPKHAEPQQEATRPIRILVEGESSVSRTMIEALRRENASYNIKLEFISDFSDPYDIRLIVSNGSGSDSTLCSCDTTSNWVTVYNTTAIALGRDGKLLFTANRAAPTQQLVNQVAAVAVIKNIYRRFDALKQEAIAAKEAASNESQEPPKEPGVYYKDGSNWVLLPESLPKAEVRGAEKWVMTFGIASIRGYDTYNGASAKLQITQTRPEFYVRGFPISEKDLVILQLKKVGAQREIETGTFTSRGKKSGLNHKDIHTLIATQIHDTIYKLVPEQDLNPGEYVLDLFLSEPGSGFYEFGITTAKQ